jgi:hypothetical protein
MRAAVVGGAIGGLAAAYRLEQPAHADHYPKNNPDQGGVYARECLTVRPGPPPRNSTASGASSNAAAPAATAGRAPPARHDRPTQAQPPDLAPQHLQLMPQHQDLKLVRPFRTTKENQQLEQTANDPVNKGQTLKQQTSSTHLPTLPP